MSEKSCYNCQYFLQHFTLTKSKLIRVYCGHCTFGQVRRKKPDAKACENYLPGSPPENAFATKEYLSRELLQYVLKLELLPEIDEESE